MNENYRAENEKLFCGYVWSNAKRVTSIFFAYKIFHFLAETFFSFFLDFWVLIKKPFILDAQNKYTKKGDSIIRYILETFEE